MQEIFTMGKQNELPALDQVTEDLSFLKLTKAVKEVDRTADEVQHSR
jgi:hypothetical protein